MSELLELLDVASHAVPLGLLHMQEIQSWFAALHTDPVWDRGKRVRVDEICWACLSFGESPPTSEYEHRWVE